MRYRPIRKCAECEDCGVLVFLCLHVDLQDSPTVEREVEPSDPPPDWCPLPKVLQEVPPLPPPMKGALDELVGKLRVQMKSDFDAFLEKLPRKLEIGP